MGEPMVVDVDKGSDQKMAVAVAAATATKKRKRVGDPLVNFSSEEKGLKIKELEREMEGLYGFYKELVVGQRLIGENEVPELIDNNINNLNLVIGCLMEESGLPLSRLVEEIHGKVDGKVGNVTAATVKSGIVMLGQRVCYGVADANADVLEDDSASALWCWETRDLKWMPKSKRVALKVRRTCRKKIHERIAAVSGMINALKKSEDHQGCRQQIVKASEKLSKVLSEADIRVLMESMGEKTGAEMAGKEVNREEKRLIKQLEKNKRDVEKEKKRMDRELQKEKLQSEKEQKRLQEEAEKEEKRREKEESEMRRQLKRQQDEAEKEQRRKEKEEAEIKKQLLLQKQASLMERFLKRSKTDSASQNDQYLNKVAASDSFPIGGKKGLESVAMQMDSILFNGGKDSDDIWKLHLSSWRCLGRAIRSNRKMCWGLRRKPKTELIKEIKLTTHKGLPRDNEMGLEKLADDCIDSDTDGNLCHISGDSSLSKGHKVLRRKQLFQFDKSNRPAFYGVWPKTSNVIGARHPFAKDPDLDYEIDSDEEWEEEEPGESLSDCDKDEEDESLEEGCSRGDDEDESEDGFFVPDGYLSENEGVQVDKRESDHLADRTQSSLVSEDAQSDEFCNLVRQQKYLRGLTERALRKNQALIIVNLFHDKTPLVLAKDLGGTEKVEYLCLQALCMRAFPGAPSVDISPCNDMQENDQPGCHLNSERNTTPVATTTAPLDLDLPKFVSVVQSCSHGMNKLVESLQQNFPAITKSQLKSKVREISDFKDNRWQVKKNILDNLGLSISPEKSNGRMTKNIATFFSKRCLPPSGKTINPIETSPQSSHKLAVSDVKPLEEYKQ